MNDSSKPFGKTLLLAFSFEEPLDFKSSHAAGSRSGNRLTITAVLYIAASVDAGHARVHVIVGDEVAIRIGIKLFFEHARVGNVPDAEEHGAGRKIVRALGAQIAQL